jgi:hypothetical protein
MVSFLVCFLAYPECELECLGEVVEPRASFQLVCAVALDDISLGHLLLWFLDLIAQRRLVAPAGSELHFR